jgi:hypothetical protein
MAEGSPITSQEVTQLGLTVLTEETMRLTLTTLGVVGQTARQRRRLEDMSGVNRIDIVVPGGSVNAGPQRDLHIQQFMAMGLTNGTFLRYTDINSGWGTWWYYAVMMGTSNHVNVVTIGTVLCTGMLAPPSGSNIDPTGDPTLAGPFSTLWSPVGAPISLSTPGISGGGQVPAQNSSGYLWRIPGNSTTAAADFTAAIAAINGSMPGTVVNRFFKYVDSVSGAWQVSALWFAPGQANPAGTVSVQNSTIMYVVTCSGTPRPPSGSSIPAVSIPGFAQTFVNITAPLSFGPTR